MTLRPTREHLAHTQGLLEELAHRDPHFFADIATALDLLVWVDGEAEAARLAAAYGPGGPRSPEGGGTIGAHTVGRHGLGRPVEQRLDWGTDLEDEAAGRRRHRRVRPELADPLYRQLRDLRSGCRTELARLVDGWRDRADRAANYPQRTKQTG